MRIPGVKTFKRFSRWARSQLTGGALILGYHNLADRKDDDYQIAVTPEHFAEQMEVLSKVARPIALGELVRCLKSGSVPPKAVAVTFDDGYADNLYAAKPILERYAIPATVFVCTGYAGKEFWWDELDRMIMSSTADLDSLPLDFNKSQFMWKSPDPRLRGHPKSRRKFRQDLYNFLLTLDANEQTQALDTIRKSTGISSGDASVRAMTSDELLQLVRGGLIELGAHTRHHPMLPTLAFERQRDEIAASKQDLEELLNERVEGFAYPNGQATEAAKRIVREEGFLFACTSLEDVVTTASDLHALPRFWQKDVDGDAFAQGLRLWMRGI